MASGGYPGSYTAGKVIEGLDAAEAWGTVFHAGTKLDDGGQFITAGGRVLGVTALADDLASARALAYEAVGMIRFEGAHFRRDIAVKGLSA
jgi:phosphoribosylamine--glycine ligase